MINHMNKGMNHTFLPWKTVQGIEKIEHGLARNPTVSEFKTMESNEHNLRKPTMSKLLKIETKEHIEEDDMEENDDSEEDDSEENDKKQSGPQNFSLGDLIIKSTQSKRIR